MTDPTAAPASSLRHGDSSPQPCHAEAADGESVLQGHLDRIAGEPHDLPAYFPVIGILHQQGRHDRIDALIQQAPEPVRLSAEIGILQAIFAESLGDVPNALDRWADLSRRHPGLAKAHENHGRLLLLQRRPDEAEAVFAAMPEALRSTPEALVLAIRLAAARTDWVQARDGLDRLLALVDAAPGAVAPPILEELAAIVDKGEAGERRAEAVRQAHAAEAEGQWPRAKQIWTGLVHDHPDDRQALAGLACHLRDCGDHDEADAQFEALLRRFPGDLEIMAHHAQVPERRDDWPSGAARWRGVLASSPAAILFAGMAAHTYAKAGDTQEAMALLDAAEAADPGRTDLAVPQARVAEYAHDWGRAVIHWKRALRLQPDNKNFREQLGKAVWHRAFEPGSKYSTADEAAAPRPMDSARDKENVEHGFETLVQSFENLCDTCEFGLVQRHYGVEPVSLFRFAGVTPEKLVELLALEFAPIGDPQHTRVEDQHDEYLIYDDRGYFILHSMVKKSEVHAQRYLQQQTARLGFLKRKQIADLQAARKTFICRRTGDAISDEMLLVLSAGMRRYGDNLLLGIRVADADNPIGTVRWLNEDIMIGHIGFTFFNDASAVDHEGWLKVLQRAAILRSERAAARVNAAS